MGGVNGELEKGGVNRQWVMGMTMGKRVKTERAAMKQLKQRRQMRSRQRRREAGFVPGAFQTTHSLF